MSERVLMVDDDENLLRASARQFRKQFDLDTALGGAEGLRCLDQNGSYAVIVSDMRMPEMDGVEFLRHARERAPDSVRMMLTGNSDLETAVAAVNDGHVFRFITKPCPTDRFAEFIRAGIAQYRLVTAERALLEDTLSGAIEVCAEILSAVDARTYGHALEVRELIRPIGAELGVADMWQLEVAALLARIGNAAVPPVVVVRSRRGNPLTGAERDMIAAVPRTGHDLLTKIPRLGPVAEIVLYSDRRFDGSGAPADGVEGTAIPLCSRILKAVSDFVGIEAGGVTKHRALVELKSRDGWYDPAVLQAVEKHVSPAPGDTEEAHSVPITFGELRLGDLLTSNIETAEGLLVVPAGTFVSSTLLARMKNFVSLNEIREPVQVQRVGACADQP